MYFQHSRQVWADFPELVPGVLVAEGITPAVPVCDRLARLTAIAESRLDGVAEGELPEIRAWRRAFTRMGLKPTQYRCASEALLRRFRKEGALPRIHALIDICNAVSVAFAIPIAVFDVARVEEFLEVRPATGVETYRTFGGDTEHPDLGEIIFADQAGHAHARRWTNRQSAQSAVQHDTSTVLIVAEAVHGTARADIERLTDTLADELHAIWSITAKPVILTQAAPRFEF